MGRLMTKETIGWKIEFFATVRGKSPVVEFIDGLQARERAKVIYHLELLSKFGINLRKAHARPLVGHKPLRELKPGPIRLVYFAHKDRRFIILHAFRKKGRKTPQQHIEKAKRRMDEFLEGEK